MALLCSHCPQADTTSSATFSQVKMIKLESGWPEPSLRTAFIQRNLQSQTTQDGGRDADTRTHRPRTFQDQPWRKAQGTRRLPPPPSELDPRSPFEKFLLRVLWVWVQALLSPLPAPAGAGMLVTPDPCSVALSCLIPNALSKPGNHSERSGRPSMSAGSASADSANSG